MGSVELTELGYRHASLDEARFLEHRPVSHHGLLTRTGNDPQILLKRPKSECSDLLGRNPAEEAWENDAQY